jgi:uncharacterized protein YigA (DUF484 family)
MDLPNLKKRIQELRGEISDLVAINKENRIQGSLVGWQHQVEHQVEHQARLTRVQEIKDELEKLIPKR